MKFARYTFLAAGIYGLLVMIPQYFLEKQIGIDSPPAITHPEFYYGFIGITVAFQTVFLVIAKDPIKYRLLIVPSLIEKFSFVVAVAALFFQQRVTTPIVVGASIDLFLALLFLASWFLLSKHLREVTDSNPIALLRRSRV